MGRLEKLARPLSQLICWLNFAIWRGASQLSIEEPQVDARMKFYEQGSVDATGGDAATILIQQQKIIKSIYSLLAILDSKASALMRYNGIILAVVGLFVRLETQHGVHGIDLAIMLVTLFSIMLCLLVVGIFWRFLELAFPADGGRNIEFEIEQLKRVLHLRETSYQLAWLLAVVVTFLLAIRFIWHP
jgi:hypothetical protein